MDRKELYDTIASRKSKAEHFESYRGGNGRVDRCVQLVDKLCLTGEAMLDVGGSIGDLCQALQGRYKRQICLDIAAQPLKAAESKGAMTLLCDIDRSSIPLLDGHVQLVTALDFIEHIVDPEHFAREAFRCLTPGGVIIVNTPNMMYWRHIITLSQGHFPHTSGDREVFHGGHLAFFTFSDVKDILEGAGFRDVVPYWGSGPDRPPMHFDRAMQMLGSKVDHNEFSFGDLQIAAHRP